jgi:hypothetical protein
MIALALYLLRCRVTHTATSEATELLAVAIALKVGSMHCLLILSLQSRHQTPDALHQRGSCIAQPFCGYQSMQRMEFAMSTASTTKIKTVCTEVACNTVRDLIQSKRFICQFDDAGLLHLTELKAGVVYLEVENIAEAIRSGVISSHLLPEILNTAAALLCTCGEEE